MLRNRQLVRTNVMLDKELLDSIDEFAEMMAEDRSTAIRQLIKKAIIEEKIILAIKKFQEGVSFRRAAQMAGVEYWEFQMELDKRGIPMMSSFPLVQKRISKEL